MGCLVERRLTHLCAGAAYDVSCADERPEPARASVLKNLAGFHDAEDRKIPGISHVNCGGRQMPVLKILQTSHCQFNCNYCAFRRDLDRPRESLSPAEIASITTQMSGAGLVEGLFLSSGIGGSIRETMTRIVDTARILREKHLFTGYIHLKILPGSTVDLIEAAGHYADRLSVNMEAPTESALRDIAPNKSIKSGILSQMQSVETLRRQGRIPYRVGQVTQFVVGGSDDPGANDRAMVLVADYLYRELEFRRIYYSAFDPVPGTPLQDRAAEDPRRSHRLYQADRLVALYGFKPDEFIFNESGKLDLDADPKETWARSHPELFPIDVATAEPIQLLRIPGVGPLLAKRILQARVENRLKSVDDFLKLGRVSRKALDYILVNGRAAVMLPGPVRDRKPPQLELPFGAMLPDPAGAETARTPLQETAALFSNTIH